ncbi:nitrogen fixation/metabolism regulation signal transduction histidine kinase [Dokdonella fugitiva]|uniref:histidine kinase n=1 Tax=Dokdonella fugitiva TaxID=328517 RepID=A0A839F891_9GAMM|nr:ATP-binding protein [Dokdonella fugitiva]MBA8889758.1 nitrogen fixation/metabolism regulation signal transduction histidine kinase [Dokdonella fugitiva]
MRLVSLEGKLVAALFAAVVAAAAIAGWATVWFASPWYGAAATVLVLGLPALVFARQLAQPVASLIRALSGSVVAFRDGDFSFSIGTRRADEVGELVAAHNELGRVLREQRQHLFQRELLLDTVVQNTPTALVLVEPGGHVVYANVSARQLLNDGRTLSGENFDELVASAPAPLARAIASGGDSLFSVPFEHEDETFHLSQREFKLQGRPHRLFQIKRLTRELARQEVMTWKKVIRVISHEINNSLGPIRSLSHSGRELARLGDAVRLGIVFDTIEERTRHLEGFISGYARFAKLPLPRPERIEWAPFLAALARHYPFHASGAPPAQPGWFDRAQIEQVLINLLKNAHEAGGSGDAVELGVSQGARETRIEVVDRGSGMSETVLANALLPFYSTKRAGSGLGLALAREIAEAHGGRVQLANRAGGGLAVTLILPLVERAEAQGEGQKPKDKS